MGRDPLGNRLNIRIAHVTIGEWSRHNRRAQIFSHRVTPSRGRSGKRPPRVELHTASAGRRKKEDGVPRKNSEQRKGGRRRCVLLSWRSAGHVDKIVAVWPAEVWCHREIDAGLTNREKKCAITFEGRRRDGREQAAFWHKSKGAGWRKIKPGYRRRDRRRTRKK